MRLHILGAGSLGLLWAARLVRGGLPVTLLVRDQVAVQAWTARNDLLQLEEGGRLSQWPVDVEALDAPARIECLIIATKAYAAMAALESILPRLGADSPVLMLQNGLGAQAQARSRWPQLNLLFASVTDGAWIEAPGRVVWAGRGTTRIGSAEPGAQPDWLQLLTDAGFDWQWERDIQAVLWHKLAINCAINPLSVLHDCRNGEVPAQAGVRFTQLLEELDQLLAAVGAGLPAGQLASRVQEVIERTRANSSSMRQDVAAGRRTEIDYLLGHACRTGRQHGLRLPVLEALLVEMGRLLSQRGLPLT